MKNKTKIVIAIGLMGLIIIALFLLFSPKKNTEDTLPDSSSSTISEMPEDTATFEEIIFEGDSMAKNSDYFKLDKFIANAEDMKGVWELKPMNGPNGKPLTFLTGNKKYISKNGDEFIISGYNPTHLAKSEDGIVLPSYIREESTGKRIKLFASDVTQKAFEEQWKKGQQVLSGKANAEGSILIDGALTPLFFEKDGESILVNLFDVAKYIVPATAYSQSQGSLTVRPNEFIAVDIPTTDANYGLQKTFKVNGNFFTFRSWNGEQFTKSVPVLDSSTMRMDIEYLYVMFGWRMYTDGTALHIVTDPVNVSDRTTIFTNGQSSQTTKIEITNDGKKVENVYDENGNLISSKQHSDNNEPIIGQQPEASSPNSGDTSSSEDISV